MRYSSLLAIGFVFALPAPMTSAAEISPAGVSDTIFASGFDEHLLTIDNYLSWCSVSVNGAAFTANPPPTPFEPGTVVNLFAKPVSGTFIWGYWSFTDVPGHDTSQNTTVMMTSDRTVSVCCPFTNGEGCPAD